MFHEAGGISMGYMVDCPNSTQGVPLDSAARWIAWSVIGNGKTLNQVEFWQTAKTGTVLPANITLDLRTDGGAGAPSTTILETKAASSIPTTSGRLVFPSFATALTTGSMFWVVMKNLSATPASNNITVHQGASQGVQVGVYGDASGASATMALATIQTTNSGTSWASGIQGRIANALYTYSDGSRSGWGARGWQRPTDAPVAERLNGTQSAGVRCTLPGSSSLTYNIRSVTCRLARTNASALSVRVRILNAATGAVLGTSRVYSTTPVNTGSGGLEYKFDFDTVASVAGGTDIRIAFDMNGTGNSTNWLAFGSLLLFDTGSDVRARAPFGGTWKGTRTADYTAGTPTWVDIDDQLPAVGLWLDETTPYTVAAGGSPRIGSRIGGLLS